MQVISTQHMGSVSTVEAQHEHIKNTAWTHHDHSMSKR